MSACRVKHDATNRNHQHISRIRRRVTDDRHQDQHRRQELFGSDIQHGLQTSIDKPGMLGNSDTQQCHQHDSQWCERVEFLHHLRHKLGKLFQRQHVDDLHRIRLTRFGFGEFHPRQPGRHNPGEDQTDQKKHGWVRQFVSSPLDKVQKLYDRTLIL